MREQFLNGKSGGGTAQKGGRYGIIILILPSHNSPAFNLGTPVR